MLRSLSGSVAVVLLGAALSGCQTMTADECKVANWSDIGLRDGMAGKAMTMLDERSEDCAKAGSRVDTPLYLAGRERGLASFCRIENAASLGLGGTTYAGVCPPHIDYEFRRHHQAGYAVYELRERVREQDERSEHVQRKLREADRDEDKQLKAAAKDDDRKRIRREFDDRRRGWRNELSDLDRSQRHARDELRAAESALDRMR